MNLQSQADAQMGLSKYHHQNSEQAPYPDSWQTELRHEVYLSREHPPAALRKNCLYLASTYCDNFH